MLYDMFLAIVKYMILNFEYNIFQFKYFWSSTYLISKYICYCGSCLAQTYITLYAQTKHNLLLSLILMYLWQHTNFTLFFSFIM